MEDQKWSEHQVHKDPWIYTKPNLRMEMTPVGEGSPDLRVSNLINPSNEWAMDKVMQYVTNSNPECIM